MEPYERLPLIKRADNMHEVACFDIPVTRPPQFPTPEPETRADAQVLEQGRKVLADMQSAREAALAVPQGQEEQDANTDELQSQEGDATQSSAEKKVKQEEQEIHPEENKSPTEPNWSHSPSQTSRSCSRSPPPTPSARSRSLTPSARSRSPYARRHTCTHACSIPK